MREIVYLTPRTRDTELSAPLIVSGMISGYTNHMLARRRSPQTARLRLFYINKFAAWCGKPLEDVTHDDIDGYIYSSNPDWSDHTKNSVYATLRTFYGWAHREGILPQNPARNIAPVRVNRPQQRMAEESVILEATAIANLSDRAMILLGAEGGLRVTEIATLHRDDRDGDWLRIIGKGGILRRVHISPELAAVLDEIEHTTMRHGWYFPGISGIKPIHASTAWRHITLLIHSNPHSLRRRAGTVVYRRSGNNIRLAQEFLGHKSSRTTELYIDIAADDLMHASTLTRLAA